MNPPPKQPLHRLKVEAFREFLESQSEEAREAHNKADRDHYEAEYAKFVEAYARGDCYICGKSFKTFSKEKPCVHWLLRQCKFKKKDFPLLFDMFGHTQLAAFTRWCANQDHFLGKINDLDAYRSDRKIFEYTVKWKHIEWTFDCSENDHEGHPGKHTDFPHYHFQMRIDGRPFIDFGDFHIPLTEEDLFRIDLSRGAADLFTAAYGTAGAGMQDALEIDPQSIIDESVVVKDDAESTFRLQSMVFAKDGKLDGETLVSLFKESERTGKTMASLLQKYMGDDHVVKTVVSEGFGVPDRKAD